MRRAHASPPSGCGAYRPGRTGVFSTCFLMELCFQSMTRVGITLLDGETDPQGLYCRPRVKACVCVSPESNTGSWS